MPRRCFATSLAARRTNTSLDAFTERRRAMRRCRCSRAGGHCDLLPSDALETLDEPGAEVILVSEGRRCEQTQCRKQGEQGSSHGALLTSTDGRNDRCPLSRPEVKLPTVESDRGGQVPGFGASGRSLRPRHAQSFVKWREPQRDPSDDQRFETRRRAPSEPRTLLVFLATWPSAAYPKLASPAALAVRVRRPDSKSVSGWYLSPAAGMTG